MILRSVQWRLVGIFVVLAIFLILPVGLFLNKTVETEYYNDFKIGVENGFDYWTISENNTGDEMVDYLVRQKNALYQFYILAPDKTYTILKINDGLELVYTSDSMGTDESFLTELLRSNNLVAVMAGNISGDNKTLLSVEGRHYFDYARLIPLSDADYILYFRYDSNAWSPMISEFNNIIISSLLISIVISLVLGYILSKTITVPIVRITQRARNLAMGNFDKPLEVKSDDEIGQLTQTFNYMAKSLRDTITEVSSEKNKIETILNYMTDGVIAFNLEGEIIHINPASERMLGEDISDIKFNEFCEKYDLDISLEEVLYLEELSSKEVNITAEERYIRIYFAVFTDVSKKREGIIAVLQDITEHQKLELMRREFVANVSHELRTPLTSIKSYAETLLDGAVSDPDIAIKFLGVINNETDRMTRLVRDLLQLSRLDNQQMQWNMRELSFADLVKSCIEKMQIEADIKNQQLSSYTIGHIPKVTGDRDRLEQVIINLLSNAIKYTPIGGVITVYIGTIYSEVYVKLVDNGIGIPKKDQTRIFERFYRVDKARSREMGGTGLGLAIAKEITEVHNGIITINSELGNGTEVVVRLPISRKENKLD